MAYTNNTVATLINIVVISAYELLIIIAATYKVPNKGWALFTVLDTQYCIHSGLLGIITSENSVSERLSLPKVIEQGTGRGCIHTLGSLVPEHVALTTVPDGLLDDDFAVNKIQIQPCLGTL